MMKLDPSVLTPKLQKWGFKGSFFSREDGLGQGSNAVPSQSTDLYGTHEGPEAAVGPSPAHPERRNHNFIETHKQWSRTGTKIT